MSEQELNRLSGKFVLPLDHPIRVYRHQSEALGSYTLCVDDFDVAVELVGTGAQSSFDSEVKSGHATHAVGTIEIVVSRDVGSAPPQIITTELGRDLEPRAKWVGQYRSEYEAVAQKVARRVLKFVKYTLRTPGMPHISSIESGSLLDPPVWLFAGDEIESGLIEGRGSVLRQRSAALLGELDLTANLDKQLVSALEDDVKPELHEEFLVDAQSSLVEGNLRRGVIELAVACEIAAKYVLYPESSPAGRVVKEMGEKGPSVPKLVASFKDVDADAWHDIEYLFQCRNKAVHHGRMEYKDKHSTEKQATRSTIEGWWQSVEKLMGWIQSNAWRD